MVLSSRRRRADSSGPRPSTCRVARRRSRSVRGQAAAPLARWHDRRHRAAHQDRKRPARVATRAGRVPCPTQPVQRRLPEGDAHLDDVRIDQHRRAVLVEDGCAAGRGVAIAQDGEGIAGVDPHADASRTDRGGQQAEPFDRLRIGGQQGDRFGPGSVGREWRGSAEDRGPRHDQRDDQRRQGGQRAASRCAQRRHLPCAWSVPGRRCAIGRPSPSTSAGRRSAGRRRRRWHGAVGPRRPRACRGVPRGSTRSPRAAARRWVG